MHLNKIIKSRKCGEYKIKEINKNSALVEFTKTGYQVEKDKKSVKNGSVKDPFHPTVRGIGYIGNANTKVGGKTLKSYSVWNSILSRCYSPSVQNRRGNSAYRGCSVDPSWHCFEEFKTWYDKNYVEGWHIDKDILCDNNNTYGPDTCVFLPHRINTILIDPRHSSLGLPKGVKKNPNGNKFIASCSDGSSKTVHIGTYDTPDAAFLAYKKFKEDVIKKVARRYKGLIDERVYQFLVNYEVNPMNKI